MIRESVNINVHHVTRVEGHGNIRVRASNGEIEQCELQIVESPRFFESMLIGRRWFDVHHITSRICGICSVGHTTASLCATESAFGLTISEQSRLLRDLVFYGEQLQSHILHVYFLAAPDLLDAGSVIPLAKTHPDVVARALRLKKFANFVCEVVAGRHVHPISLWPGGLKHCPTEAQLLELKRQLEQQVLPDIDATVDLFAELAPRLPDFERPAAYMALKDPACYAWFTGELVTSTGQQVPVDKYLDVMEERVVRDTTVKHVFHNGESFYVGARARVNTNYDQLHPRAKAAAEKLGYQAPNHNPFANNAAQVIECVHCAAEAVNAVDQLLSMGAKYQEPQVAVRAGRGVGIAEVPRGTLVHDYTYDENGNVVDDNLIIPTTMNVENCEQDMRALVPQMIDHSQEQITAALEVLVRAYDPCISCSVHMLDVEFI